MLVPKTRPEEINHVPFDVAVMALLQDANARTVDQLCDTERGIAWVIGVPG